MNAVEATTHDQGFDIVNEVKKQEIEGEVDNEAATMSGRAALFDGGGWPDDLEVRTATSGPKSSAEDDDSATGARTDRGQNSAVPASINQGDEDESDDDDNESDASWTPQIRLVRRNDWGLIIPIKAPKSGIASDKAKRLIIELTPKMWIIE